jgi:hypothetical protein
VNPAAERGVAIPVASPHLRPSLTIPDDTLEPVDTRPPGERDDDEGALCDEFGVSGFATTTIRGAEYVVVITPFEH